MIIGVSGKAQAGKDEFAKVAIEEFGATQIAFADAVKEEVGEWLDSKQVLWDLKNLKGSKEDKEISLRVSHKELTSELDRNLLRACKASRISNYWYVTGRVLLQFWGTEYRRAQDPDYWVKRAFAKCENPGLYIISDVRFKNEAEAVKTIGGNLIRVCRASAPVIIGSKHISECALDDYTAWDKIIHNNSDLKTYKTAIRQALKGILDVS